MRNSIGNCDFTSIINNACSHYITYEDVYASRIVSESMENIPTIQLVDSINDGCKCSQCGLWYAMAAPNQTDNSFKCYSCRNRGL